MSRVIGEELGGKRKRKEERGYGVSRVHRVSPTRCIELSRLVGYSRLIQFRLAGSDSAEKRVRAGILVTPANASLLIGQQAHTDSLGNSRLKPTDRLKLPESIHHRSPFPPISIDHHFFLPVSALRLTTTRRTPTNSGSYR